MSSSSAVISPVQSSAFLVPLAASPRTPEIDQVYGDGLDAGARCTTPLARQPGCGVPDKGIGDLVTHRYATSRET